MKLSKYESLWKETLLGSELSAKELGIAPERLKLYRGFIWDRYQGALEKMFPRLDEIWSPDWEAVSKEYFSLYPADDFEINDITQYFPQYLEQLEVPPYYSELATYELAEFNVYRNPSKELQTKNGVLRLSKCVEIQLFEYEIASWVYHCEEEFDDQKLQGAPKQREHLLAISRSPIDYNCRFTEIFGLDLEICKLVDEVDFLESDLIQTLQKTFAEISAEDITERISFLKKQYIII